MPVIESDWPSELKIDVVTPLIYLKTQAAAVGSLTKGAIEARVKSTTTLGRSSTFEESQIHKLILVAPALEDYEIELLSVTHPTNVVYPCEVKATGRYVEKYANTFDELRVYVREILRSSDTTSKLHSILAKVNELSQQ